MTRKLELLDDALHEAEDAARWYAERSPTAAAGFADELEGAILAIEGAPALWPRHDFGTRRYLLRRFPYSVVYKVERTRIVIIAVAHGHRRPGYWQGRLIAPG
ncbi:MAG: type II toxin-antitoxin system RelE/ParE family toxin [Vicinamibacterales bacterium]